MKKERILDVLSLVVIIGAVLLELFKEIKETEELSIRSLLMYKSSSISMNYVFTHTPGSSQ